MNRLTFLLTAFISILFIAPSFAGKPARAPKPSGTITVAPVRWFFAQRPGDTTSPSILTTIYYDVNLYGTANTIFEFYASEAGMTPKLVGTVAANNLSWTNNSCFGTSAQYTLSGFKPSTGYMVYTRVDQGGKKSIFKTDDHPMVTYHQALGGCYSDGRPDSVDSWGFRNTSNSIEINWIKSRAINAKEFRIYLVDGDNDISSPATLVAQIASNDELAQEFVIPNLTPWRKYCFAVSAVDFDGVETGKRLNCSSTLGPVPVM